MVIEVYRIIDRKRLSRKSHPVTYHPRRQLADVEQTILAVIGAPPGGVIAIPRLGRLQREALRALTQSTWIHSITWGNRPFRRLCDFGLATWRLSGGGSRGGYMQFDITTQGRIAAQVLRLTTEVHHEH